MSMPTDKRAFMRRLRGARRRLRVGAALLDLARFAALVVALGTLYVLADYFLALPVAVRVTLNAVAALAAAAYWARALWGWLEIDLHTAARHLDTAAEDRRKSVLTALELHSDTRGGGGAMQAHLIGQVTAQAVGRMKALSIGRTLPLAAWRRAAPRVLVGLALAAVLYALPVDALRRIQARLSDPRADIPPWTALQFAVTPSPIEVLYGSDADLSVTVTGAPVDQPVILLTRRNGETRSLACYREDETRFAQRLERVTEPMQVAFAVGRARSDWYPVGVLMRPQITVARVRIIPPTYAHLPIREFDVGGQVIEGLVDSTVELTIVSNRPLSGGEAVREERVDDHVVATQTHAAEPVETSTVVFRFPLRRGQVSATVRDLQGTPTREPLTVHLSAAEDEPPVVQIHDPGNYVLATPSTKIELRARADDDLGLRRVGLVRTVVGYRDRITTVGPPKTMHTYDYDGTVDLLLLGSEPGQILEFYLEAVDHNPTLMGVGSSEIVRVEVISEEAYAEILRSRADLDEFIARFDEVAAAQKKLGEALDALAKATGEAERQAALDAAKAATEETMALYDTLGQDFPIFDAEGQMRDLLLEALTDLGTAREQLKALRPDAPDFQERAESLRDRFRQDTQGLQDLVDRRGELREMKENMSLAARIRKVEERQGILVRGLSRYEAQRLSDDPEMLAILGKRQAEIQAELVQIQADLREQAGKLEGPRYDEIRAGMLKMADDFDEKQVPDLMQAASEAGGNNMGTITYELASLALERMQEARKNGEGNEFGDMCQPGDGGQKPGDGPPGQGSGPGDSMARTREQMMQNLLNRRGLSDGSSSGGSTPTDVPVLGPARSDRGKGGDGPGDGSSSDNAEIVQGGAGGSADPVAPRTGSGNTPPPPKYRDAIRRYFSSPTTPATP